MSDFPTGRPEDGRPKLSKDKKKRKQRRETPRTKSDFVNLMLWATEAQKGVSDILNPALLNHYGKKNVRSLTREEQNELEYIKLGVLSDVSPFSEITADLVNNILQGAGVDNVEMLEMCTKLTKEFSNANERAPSMDEMRQIRSSAYAMYYENA